MPELPRPRPRTPNRNCAWMRPSRVSFSSQLSAGCRGEPPNIAAKSIVTYSGSLGQVRRVFNAQLDYLDERETAVPYLAEAIPALDTDTWRVFADGRMETTYHLRPNLSWHDGRALTA